MSVSSNDWLYCTSIPLTIAIQTEPNLLKTNIFESCTQSPWPHGYLGYQSETAGNPEGGDVELVLPHSWAGGSPAFKAHEMV